MINIDIIGKCKIIFGKKKYGIELIIIYNVMKNILWNKWKEILININRMLKK